MGFAKYLEDNYRNLENQFKRFNKIWNEIPEAQTARRVELERDLSHVKIEIDHSLDALGTQILELMTDPNFEVYDAWQNTLAQCKKLEAERDLYRSRWEYRSRTITISAHADPEVKNLVVELSRIKELLKAKDSELEAIKKELATSQALVNSLSKDAVEEKDTPTPAVKQNAKKEQNIMENSFADLGVQKLSFKKKR